MKATILALLLLFMASSASAELPPTAQQEVAHLLSHMERSNCEFNRNGSWYGAVDASAHIRKKYQYLLQRDLLSSAEDFIVGAASESSLSKQAYLVRCPGEPVMDSSTWFRRQLKQYRQGR